MQQFFSSVLYIIGGDLVWKLSWFLWKYTPNSNILYLKKWTWGVSDRCSVEFRKVKNLHLDFWNGTFIRIFSYSKLSCMGIHTIFTHIFICSQSLATKGSDVNLFGGIILFFKKNSCQHSFQSKWWSEEGAYYY